MADQPRTPGLAPNDVPRDLLEQATQPATVETKQAEKSGSNKFLWYLALGGALFLILRWRKRRKQRADNGLNTNTPSAHDPAAPQPHYRLGQMVVVDPSPFLLAGDAIAAKLPASAGADGRLSAQSVSVLTTANNSFERLYLDDLTYLHLHLDQQGTVDECRLFTVIDEITPADQNEWAAWLNDKTGTLGAAEFIMPDGTDYRRVWSPGTTRVPPLQFQEFLHTLEEQGEKHEQAQYLSMLYRRETGLHDPAPTVDYRLVSVVESKGEAWIEIAAGIDINPASLSLV